MGDPIEEAFWRTRYEVEYKTLAIYEDKDVTGKAIQLGHWVKVFVHRIIDGELLGRWTVDARHWFWLQANGGGFDMGKYVEAAKKRLGKKSTHATAEDSAFAEGYPAVWDFLTSTAMKDGEVRETATLLLFVEEGVWKACFNDRDAERTVWASASTFQGALEALEKRVADPDTEWREKAAPKRGEKGRGRG